MGKAWKIGVHVSSCIDVTFLGQIVPYFQKPSCHSEVQLQESFEKKLAFKQGFPKVLASWKTRTCGKQKETCAKQCDQQKSKLALHNNIVTSHDAHDMHTTLFGWLKQLLNHLLGSLAGNNPSSAFVPSIGTNNFAFGTQFQPSGRRKGKRGGSILQYLIFTTHHQPYLFLLKI